MTRYRTLFSTVLLASCLTGFAVPAIAAPYECWPKGDHGSFYEHRGERLERHHNKVLEALKLSPDQDGAWKKFVAAESPMVKNRNDPKRSRRMKDIEKLEQRIAVLGSDLVGAPGGVGLGLDALAQLLDVVAVDRASGTWGPCKLCVC